ncbi:MAG: pyroglutamyl-peptidase I [Thermoplasmatales archaeon]|nr:pyroglutamyl-peptidase I [Thermoplasmatales archaeon]
MRLIRNIVIVGTIFLTVASPLACGITFTNFHTGNEFASNTPIVLVTGFEPFDIYEINPSQLIAETLDGQNIEGAEIIGIILPVNFNESVEVVIQAIIDYNPLLVISMGLSPSAHKINVEKCGINLKWLPRNESMWFTPRRLDPCGPFIHLSPLHTREIVLEIREAGIPSRQSFFAGLYVCNAVFYGTLGYIKEHEISTTAGFIHVPLLSSQDPDGMDLETMIEAVKVAIKTSLY